MASISEVLQGSIENSLSVVEQKITEKLEKEPKYTLLIEEGKENPKYHLRNDSTGFYAMKVENYGEISNFKWRKNSSDAKNLLDEDIPRIEYGEIFKYSFEEEMSVPDSD